MAAVNQPVVPEPVNPILCNCYAYVKSQIPDLPQTRYLKPNSVPFVGAVAIFDYNGLPHYAIVTKLEDSGFWLKDSNYGGCGIRTHFITWNTKALVGFWGG